MYRVMIPLVLLLGSGTGFAQTPTQDEHDSDEFYCDNRFDASIKKESLIYFSELMGSNERYMLVEAGNVNYHTYDYLYIGVDEGRGVVASNYRYWPKGESDHRVYYVDEAELIELFDLARPLQSGVKRRYEKSNVEDGECYALTIKSNRSKKKISMYSPATNCNSNANESECMLGAVLKYFENKELNKRRYINFKRYFQEKNAMRGKSE